MAEKLQFKLTGFAELGKTLRNLDEKSRTKIGNAAAGGAAYILREASRKQAEENGLFKTGALIKNIAMAREPARGGLEFSYTVGVRHGTKKQIKQTKAAGSNVNDPWYWYLHEFGTSKMPKRPFITPSMSSVAVRERMLESMRKIMQRGIDRSLAETVKKAS